MPENKIDAPDVVEMVFDTEEAKGTVRLTRGPYGATLTVNDKEVGYIDVFPVTQGNPPQVLFFHEHLQDELFVKIVLEPTGMVAVVHANAVPGYTEHTIHTPCPNAISDRVYTWNEEA